MKTLSISLVTVFMTATFAQAQQVVPIRRVGLHPVNLNLHSVQPYTPRVIYPGYVGPQWRGYHYHASTAAEGYARGIAAMTRAQGEYNRLTAEANIANAEARGREIENKRQATATYFALREANLAARAAERKPRSTASDLARRAAQAKPDRLSPSELSVAKGEVSWPVVLMTDEFAPFRAEVEKLFNQRAANGQIATEHQAEIQKLTKTMLLELKRQIREVPPMDYTMARQFIESLAYEARLPLS